MPLVGPGEYADLAGSIGTAPTILREDGEVPVNAICETLYGDMPHAREAFCEALAEHEIAPEEPVPLSGAAVRRLEKQSLRSGDGVEIKVPVSLYKNEKAIEFIHNEDGTTSLLVKNILL